MNRYEQYMYSYPHKTAYRPLKNENLRDYMESLEGEGHSLYLHLPFCESKCGYCNLFSVAGCGRDAMEAYLKTLLRQIEQYREILPKSTRFGDFTIGGGTPLLLDAGQLERMFRAVGSYMPMTENCEIVIETAPKQTDREKVRLLKELGVTRVSMGIQSFAEKELLWLGRHHDAGRAREAAELLAEAGFDCVNLDFIYGLPGQTAESLTESLERAAAFSPEEIFLYPLYIKHGVGLERTGKGILLDSDHTYSLYLEGVSCLKSHGYVQVSMRRFVKMERVDYLYTEYRTDSKLAKGGEDSPEGGAEFRECGFTGALALGCGGRSYLGRLHTCTPYQITRQAAMKEIREYQSRTDFLAVTHGILLSDEEIRRRYVIRHLLIRPGIRKQAFQERFGTAVTEAFPILEDWMEAGWAEETDGFLGLTQEGLGLSDYIGPKLISEEIRRKMQEWEQIYGQENGFLQGQSEKL